MSEEAVRELKSTGQISSQILTSTFSSNPAPSIFMSWPPNILPVNSNKNENHYLP